MTHPPSTLKGAKSVARSHTRPSRPRKHEKTCKKEAVGGGDCHQPAVGTIKTCPHVSHVPVPAHQPAHTPQPKPKKQQPRRIAAKRRYGRVRGVRESAEWRYCEGALI